MANPPGADTTAVLSLAMKVNADASAFLKGLTPAERALRNLGGEADKTLKIFDRFAGESTAAADAQAKLAERFDGLRQALKDGLNPEEFARQFESLREEAARTADQIQQDAEAARRAEEQAARERERMQAEADRIRFQNLSAQEQAQRQFDASVARTEELERAGLLTRAEANKEIERQANLFAKAAIAAGKLGTSGEDAARKTLKFNELSGVLSALPGPIGNVAGRLSGLASAGEGLARVFDGGLRSGLSAVGSSIAGLVNPFTAGLAAVTAFGVAATGVVRGLTQLDDRVEKLGNTADKLGVSFEFIQTLEEAANRSGTSIDAVSAAFVRLQKSVLGVDEESKAAQKALSDLGLTAADLQRLRPEEQYQLIGERIAGIEDPARRTAAAINLFGRAGADLLPFFNNIAGAANDIDRFAARLSQIDRDRVDSLGSSFDRIVVSLRGLGQSALLPFAGVVEGIGNLIADVIGTITRLAQAIGTVLTPVLDAVGAAFTKLGDGIAAVNGFFDWLVGASEQTATQVGDLRQEMQPLTEEFVKQAAELQKAGEVLAEALNKGIAEAGRFGQEGFDAAMRYQKALADIAIAAEDSGASLEQVRAAQERARAEFDANIATLEAERKAQEESAAAARKAAEDRVEAARRAAEADRSRVDAFIDGQRTQQEREQQAAAQTLDAIRREQERSQLAIEQARLEGDANAVQREQERLALLERQEAIAADIATGERARREEEQRAVERLVAEAERLGQEQDRAEQQRLKEQEQERIRAEQAVAQERQRVANAVDQLVFNNLAREEQARITAAKNVALIEQEIEATQQALRAARKGGDDEAAAAAARRLQQLDQVLAKEEAIANGRAQKEREIASIREQQMAAAQKMQEELARQQQQAQQQYLQEIARQREEEQRAIEAEAQRQNQRLAALNTVGQQSVRVGDVRTAEGANLVLDLASNAQDPRLIQERMQTKLLQQIALSLAGAAANYFNQPVAIVGEARLG